MAKGWESKAAEEQIQTSLGTDPKNNQRQLLPEQLEEYRRREVLLLSRTRVEQALQASQNPRYREQLRQALADLDAQLSAMKSVDS